ncbi:hypothetical protein DY000_02006342 [Brassica cretica]|uniref:Uncharacterized protein n=1 Tax=Brassica cretica TaxID=69181 RepID=A0ABQ7CIR6_BRACR|nr:hypothetical protein DY000_02006342 [Brassica cretica]
MDCWSLENDLVTRRLQEDPEVVEEPGGFSLTIRDSLTDPEIVGWNPEVSVIVIGP